MGAEQSRSQDNQAPAADAPPRKTCYYELLGVELQADDAEIRKAYKRKALELHPDRNFGDVENATRRFAEVQTAYEILSDPQERAWYDSHRDAILGGTDVDGGPGPAEFHNVRLTTADELFTLIGRFNSSVPFTDAPAGFFGILDETFGHLADEEAAAWEFDTDGQDPPPEYPPFGSAADTHDDVRPFYAAWSGFATRKSFSWRDKYRLSDAPDRYVRRLMEKENKKIRQDAAREFNDAVRSLVAFVKKRDPRYVPNKQSEAERQRVLRDSAAAQAARSRAANQERLAAAAAAVPDWAQQRDDEKDAGEHEFVWSEDEASEVETIECVVCNKTFKSEAQFEAHEKSKKHAKAVQQLRWEMRRDNMDLDLGAEDEQPAKATPTSGSKEKQPPKEEPGATAEEPTMPEDHAEGDSGDQQAAGPTNSDKESSLSAEETEDYDYASRDAVQDRLASGHPRGATDGQDDDASLDGLAGSVDNVSIQESSAGGGKKMGKAKAKKEKKAAKQAAAASQPDEITCGVCQEAFLSRTKLFNHIREEGHAELKPATKGAGSGKKQKGKR